MDPRYTWPANLLLIVGASCMSPKRRWPFLLTAAGEAIYVATSMVSGQVDLAFICVVFGGLAANNYVKWERER